MQFDFRGGDRSLEQVMRSASVGRIVHALILAGERGTGRHTAALAIAQAMLCTGEKKPCLTCPACLRCAAHTHPDLHWITPEEDKKAVSIAQIRGVIGDIARRPFEGGARVVVIDPADNMGDPAQNALLKTLEEPGEATAILLIAEHTAALLPTIRSRCRTIRFAPLGIGACEQALLRRGIPQETADLAAALSRGSVGRALEIAEKGTENWDAVLSSLSLLADGGIAGAVAVLNGKSPDKSGILDFLETWARDKMLYDDGAEPYTSPAASRLDAIRLNGREVLLAVGHIRQKISSNVSWQHALESAYIEIMEEQSTWQP